MLPLAFDVAHRDVLVIGMGRLGAHKSRQLLDAGARVHVIASALLASPPEGLASLRVRAYEEGDLAGYVLVVSAVADTSVNDLIVREAKERGVWLNVVDDLERSNFYFMALVRRGDVCVAVTTEGASPALAQELRDRVADVVPTHVGEVANELRAERQRLHDVGASTEGRDWRQRVRELLDVVSSQDLDA